MAEGHATDGFVGGQDFELGHGRLHEATHGSAACGSAVPMPFGHRGQHVGDAAEACDVAVLALWVSSASLGSNVSTLSTGSTNVSQMVNSTSGTVAAPAMFAAMRRTKSSVCSWTSSSPSSSNCSAHDPPDAASRSPWAASKSSRSRGAVRRSRGSRRAIRRAGHLERCLEQFRRQVVRSHDFGTYPSREREPRRFGWCRPRAFGRRGTRSPVRVNCEWGQRVDRARRRGPGVYLAANSRSA